MRIAVDPGVSRSAGDAVKAEQKRLPKEAALAAEMGFDAAYVEFSPLLIRPAMQLANQLKFHPLKYVSALAREIVRLGGKVFEKTEVSHFQDKPRRAMANGYRIAFEFSVLATHVPLQGNVNTLTAALLQTKLAGDSTYAVAARVPNEYASETLWWDTGDPYLYLRVDRNEGGDIVILGGEDHKTGQETDIYARYERLEQKLRSILPSATVERRWSGQVIESVDGLPYIGEVEAGQFVATGFAGNGMTFGTLAGMMARDVAMGTKNPWQELFAVERKKLSATWDYVRENRDYPFYLAKGRLASGTGDLSDLTRGAGAIVRVDGQKAAAFRDDDGALHVHSAICPHLGCVVAWNEAERTWDCPCTARVSRRAVK